MKHVSGGEKRGGGNMKRNGIQVGTSDGDRMETETENEVGNGFT